jgi:hypothetical protein
MLLTNTFFAKNCDEPFEVEFDYAPYQAAKTWGPPEDCYEAEGGEAEIEDINSEAGNSLLDQLHPKVIEELKDKAESWARSLQSRGELHG